MYYYEVIEMYRRVVLLGVLPVSYWFNTDRQRQHGFDSVHALPAPTFAFLRPPHTP